MGPPQDPNAPADYNGLPVVILAILFCVLTWLSVGARIYVRFTLSSWLMKDDICLLLTQMLFTVSCVYFAVGYTHGLGHYSKFLSQQEEIQALKWQSVMTMLYIINLMFAKLSIAFLLLRFAEKPVYKWMIQISMVIVTVWHMALFIWDVFIQCKPIAAQWDYTILQNDKTAYCADSDSYVQASYALSALTILSDWFYALIPIPIIWNLKMTAQTKLSLCFLLSLGIFSSIATLIRLKYLAAIEDQSNLCYSATGPAIWTNIELGVCICATGLVTIRPLLRKWRLFGLSEISNEEETPRTRRSTNISDLLRSLGTGWEKTSDEAEHSVELGSMGSKSGGPVVSSETHNFGAKPLRAEEEGEVRTATRIYTSTEDRARPSLLHHTRGQSNEKGIVVQRETLIESNSRSEDSERHEGLGERGHQGTFFDADQGFGSTSSTGLVSEPAHMPGNDELARDLEANRP